MLTNYIANLCPLAGGPSVYRARDLYALFNDTIQYNDCAVCAFEGYFRESANTLYPSIKKKENRMMYFKAQPNPASDIVLFTFKSNAAHASLTIYNMSGAKVYCGSINENATQLQIDVSNFTKGMYIAQYVNNETSSRIKFVVNK